MESLARQQPSNTVDRQRIDSQRAPDVSVRRLRGSWSRWPSRTVLPCGVPGQGTPTYLLTSGTRAGLPAGSATAGHDWLAVAEVSRAQGRDAAGTGAVIRSAAPLSAELAAAAAPELLVEDVTARFAQGRVTAVLERRLGALVLSSTPVRPSAEQGRHAVATALERQDSP